MTLVLLTGSDPFLSARGIEDTVRQWQKNDPDLGVEEISGSSSDVRLRIAEAGGEDLFGTRSILVVTEADALGDAMAALLAAADSNPVVAHHRGGRGGQAALKDLKTAAATTIDCQPLKKGRALNEFVTNEFKRQKRRITSDALALLIEAVGTDLADLASAAHQLSSDAQSDPIDAQVVGQYFRGVAELSGYQVADAVMLGHPAEVLQRLRQAQIAADGVPPSSQRWPGRCGNSSRCRPAPLDSRTPTWRVRSACHRGNCGHCGHNCAGGSPPNSRRRSRSSPTSMPV